ncbi:MAG: GNAT family N-acetyltransferase [Planctomycetota bacterium]
MMSERGWTIRHYQPGDEHGILELFNRVFAVGNPDFVPRTLRQWRWQFDENPLKHHTLVAVDDAGRIVGEYTAIPAMMNMNGVKKMGCQAVDSCVDAEYRHTLKREGLFLTLARAFFDYWARPDRDCIVYGLPNPQAFRIGTRLIDYRPVHCPVPKLVLPVATALPRPSPPIELEVVSELPGEIEQLYRSLGKTLEFSTWRDAAYLNWRYAHCPHVRYTIVLARNASRALRGMLVYRLGWIKQKVAPLVDLLVGDDDRDTLVALLAHARAAAAAAQLEALEAWMPRGFALYRALRLLGCREEPSPFNLCIRIFTPLLTVPYAIERWYYTMGDSDIY